MYKLFFIFIISFFSAQQKCNLSFSNSQFLRDGNFVLIIKNIGKEKLKIPRLFNPEFAIPTDIQVYNDERKDYIDTKYSFDDPLCGDVKKCLGKMMCIKEGESKEYEIKIIPGRVSKAFKEKKKYRFKLTFDTYLFSGCYYYVTEWLYYQN